MVDCTVRCVDDCVQVFDRIFVWPQITAGDTRVEWSLKDVFIRSSTGPYTFQLQVGRTSQNTADDWVNVGAPVVDGYFALDSTKRVYGKFQWTHYRIKLTVPGVTDPYYSDPQPCMGNLSWTDWNRARDILRMEKVRLRQLAGQEGYLLKLKLFGTDCECLDPQTKENLNPEHPDCYGTGIEGGYYEPVPCVYADLSPTSHDSHLDGGAMRGTVDDATVVSARLLNYPQVHSGDVWVSRDKDFRWMIHKTSAVAEIRGVPLVLQAEMRLLPFTHPVYNLEIAGQVPS